MRGVGGWGGGCGGVGCEVGEWCGGGEMGEGGNGECVRRVRYV